MTKATDWNAYYEKPAAAATFTRSITRKKLVRTLMPYVSGPINICELGGANSSILEKICTHFDVTEYHILDTNSLGLSLLPDQFQTTKVTHALSDVRLPNTDCAERFDLTISIGLIEHFGPENTRKAIVSHLEAAKPGGLILITFPTPTFLYRLIRKAAELLGIWKFHDERPLKADEVMSAMTGQVEILHRSINWWIGLTQYYILARKSDIDFSR